MKKIAVLSLLTLLCASNCKKSTTTSTPIPKVWCIYDVSTTNKTFLYCAKSQDEAIHKSMEYRDAGKATTSYTKTICNECN